MNQTPEGSLQNEYVGISIELSQIVKKQTDLDLCGEKRCIKQLKWRYTQSQGLLEKRQKL